MFSGFITLLICYPIDVVRVRLSTEQGSVSGARYYIRFFQSWKAIKRSEGWRKGLYRGFLLSNMINIPYSITFLLTYDLLRHISIKNEDYKQFIDKYILISLCGFLAQSMVYPFDTIRS